MRPEACAAAREALPVETTDSRPPTRRCARGRWKGRPARRRRARLPRGLGARDPRVQRRAPQAVLRALREPGGLLRAGLREPGSSGSASACSKRRSRRPAGEPACGPASCGSSSSSPSGRRSPGRSSSRCRSPAGRRWPCTRRRSSASPRRSTACAAEIEPDEAPPEATGIFVVGGIEACICEVLAAGDPNRIWDALPELMHLAVGSYLGKEAAEEEFEAARELLERERAELGRRGRVTELRLVAGEVEDGPFSAGTPLPRRLPPGRHGIPANLVVEHQRRRLLAAMAEALAEHGYASLTTTQVSERASVSTSTFYKHFGNLWDCVLAAYVAAADRLCEEIEAACATPIRAGAARGRHRRRPRLLRRRAGAGPAALRPGAPRGDGARRRPPPADLPPGRDAAPRPRRRGRGAAAARPRRAPDRRHPRLRLHPDLPRRERSASRAGPRAGRDPRPPAARCLIDLAAKSHSALMSSQSARWTDCGSKQPPIAIASSSSTSS